MLTNSLIVLASIVLMAALLTRLDRAYGYPLWDWTQRPRLMAETGALAVAAAIAIIVLLR